MNKKPALDLDEIVLRCRGCSLQELCRPAGLGQDDLVELESIYPKPRMLKKDEHLFSAGDLFTSIFVVKTGAFKTIVNAEDGSEQLMAFHLRGELIGLDALSGDKHYSDAVALSDSSVCEVLLDELNVVASQLPSMQRHLLQVIGNNIGEDNKHINMLTQQKSDVRLALFLHGLMERMRQAGLQANKIDLPMTRKEIALYLGLAMETVSRSFVRLREDGIISVRGKHIVVRNEDELNRRAHMLGK